MSKPNSSAKTSDREDRTAHKATDDQSTVLTSLADTVNNQASAPLIETIAKPHKGTDPYPDSGLSEVLSRLYPVANFNWAITDTVDNTIFEGAFPDLLMNSTINDRLVHYKYFRASVEVSIRLQSTTFHKGLLQVAWLPHYLNGSQSNMNIAPFVSMFSESRLDNMIISADTQETVTFQIPYVAPSSYWDMTTDQSEIAGFFGYVSIRVLAPLQCGSNTNPINITVMARFVDPQVAGPIHYQSDITGTEMKTFSDNSSDAPFEQRVDARDADRESEVRTEKGTTASVAPAKKESMGQTILNFLGKAVGKFIDVVPRYVSAFAPLLLDFPTTTVLKQPVTIHSGASWAPTRGADNSHILSTDPENKVATDISLFNCPIDYNLFKNYILLPSLLTTGSIPFSTTSGAVVFTFPVNPMYVHSEPSTPLTYFDSTHLSSIAMLFRAWRGEIRYRIYFVASHFISARVRIEWLPEVVTATTVTNEMMGNNISKVVDINGDTIVEFTIPYLQTKHWLPVTEFDHALTDPTLGSNGCVRITMLNKMSTAQSNATADRIDWVLWCAGGPSTQFAFPTTMSADESGGTYQQVSYQSKTTQATYFNMREVFRQPFDGLIGCRTGTIHGYENGDDISSFTEYMKRYTVDPQWGLSGTQVTAQSNMPLSCWNVNVGSPLDNKDLILNAFYFQRGSWRYKIIWQPWSGGEIVDPKASIQTFAYNSHLIGDESYQSGGFYHQFKLNPQMEFQVPFYYPYPFFNHYGFPSENTPSNGANFTNYNNGEISIKLLRAVGDDFTMNWPLGISRIQYHIPV